MKRIALAAVALALGTGAACAKDLWSADQIKLVAEAANKMYAAQANPQMALEMLPSDTSMKMVLKNSDAAFSAQWDKFNDEQKKMFTDMIIKQMCASIASSTPEENVVSHVDFVELVMTNADASKTFVDEKLTEEVCAAAK